MSSESHLQALIGRRYASPAYATLLHVRSQTGFRRTTRTADAMSMSLYPSRGLELMGFEVKVSRADWARELARPDKAEEICRFCDRWWIVAGGPDIVLPGELPPTWGLLVAEKTRLVARVEAPRLEALALSREMLAGILRKVAETSVATASIGARVEAAGKESYERGVRDGQRDSSRPEEDLRRLRERVDAFESRSGLHVDAWNGAPIGEAVRLLRDLAARNGVAGAFERMAMEAEGIARLARAAATAMAGELAEPATGNAQPATGN